MVTSRDQRLVRATAPAQPPALLAEEARVRALVAEVAALDGEIELLAEDLGAFERAYAAVTADGFEELRAAERLERRVARLEGEVERLTAQLELPCPPSPRRSPSQGEGIPRAKGSADLPRPREAREKKGRVEVDVDRRSSSSPSPRDSGERVDPGRAGRGQGGESETPTAPQESTGSKTGRGRVEDDGRGRGRSHAVEEKGSSPPGLTPREIDPGELDLKRLHRRLARLLHPDLAREEGERERVGAIMARVNDAYARGDRAALELVAERLGAGEVTGDVDDEARRAHLARRAAALEDARAELAAERARLLASTARRLRDAAAARANEGGDLMAEARAAALAHAAASRARTLSGLDRLAAESRALAQARSAPRPQGGRRRRRDPVAASALVRAPAVLTTRRASPAARSLARALAEEAAQREPWRASLAVLAFLGEAAGIPPDALATRSSLEERWDALRAGWRSAPDLGRALSRLPRHLELGLRAAGDDVVAGLQLTAPDLAAGVRLALVAEPVRALARRALAVLGPRERCAACGRAGYAIHLLRVRGVDEIHALACPRCAEVLRSFWRYGPLEGLAALAPIAVEVGALAEVKVRFGGALLAFGLLPQERAQLTAADVDRRLRDLLLAPHGLAPPPCGISYRCGRAVLAPGARIPAGRTVTAAVVGATAGADAELVDAVRSRVARRFRPEIDPRAGRSTGRV